jgi:hypothetical protein
MHDFRLQNEVTIVALHAVTEAAQEWMDDNLPEDRMSWMGGAVIEPRYVQDILTGIEDAGLSVAGDIDDGY